MSEKLPQKNDQLLERSPEGDRPTEEDVGVTITDQVLENSDLVPDGGRTWNKLGKWLRGAMAAGLIVGGVGGNLEADGADSAIGGRIDNISGVETEAPILLEKTGSDIEAIAKKAGFKATLEVDNGKDPYIIHVGQMHYSDVIEHESPEDREINTKLIIANQKNIEKVALGFLSESDKKGEKKPTFFNESILVDGPEQACYARSRETLSKILPGKGCFLKVLGAYRSMEYFNNKDDSGPKMALTYLYRQKLDELESYYIAHPEDSSFSEVKNGQSEEGSSKKELTEDEKEKSAKTPEELSKILDEMINKQNEVNDKARQEMSRELLNMAEESALGIPKHPKFVDSNQELAFVRNEIKSTFDVLGKDGVYLAGGLNKLAVEGRVNMMGCETKTTNAAAGVALDKLVSLNDKYSVLQKENGLANLSESEKIKIQKEISEWQQDFKNKSEIGREDAALQAIAEKSAVLGQRVIPIVFGQVHQFNRAVLDYDSKHPDAKMGLIKLTPLVSGRQ